MDNLITKVSASPPSKFRLNPNFSDNCLKVSISSFPIGFPNQESSRPSEDTAGHNENKIGIESKSLKILFWFSIP